MRSIRIPSRILHQPTETSVSSQAALVGYGQNSHELCCYANDAELSADKMLFRPSAVARPRCCEASRRTAPGRSDGAARGRPSRREPGRRLAMTADEDRRASRPPAPRATRTARNPGRPPGATWALSRPSQATSFPDVANRRETISIRVRAAARTIPRARRLPPIPTRECSSRELGSFAFVVSFSPSICGPCCGRPGRKATRAPGLHRCNFRDRCRPGNLVKSRANARRTVR